MANDPELESILADLAQLSPADSVTLSSGSSSCRALYDDGEMVIRDGMGESIQSMETVIRYREGAITRPAVGATVTVQWGTASGNDDQAFLVDEARKDPDNPNMIRLLVRRT